MMNTVIRIRLRGPDRTARQYTVILPGEIASSVVHDLGEMVRGRLWTRQRIYVLKFEFVRYTTDPATHTWIGDL